MPALDLPPAYQRLTQTLLARYAPDAEVWAYGSRIHAAAHSGSDLDLVLRNPIHPNQAQPRLHQLTDAIEESNLPILVHVHDWALLPEHFRREIERAHVALQTPRVASVAEEP